jgi:hypothetical protein
VFTPNNTDSIAPWNPLQDSGPDVERLQRAVCLLKIAVEIDKTWSGIYMPSVATRSTITIAAAIRAQMAFDVSMIR